MSAKNRFLSGFCLNFNHFQINEHTSEVNRLQLSHQTAGMGADQKEQLYQTEIKNRDERINQLKYEIESVIQQKNKEIDALSQKMMVVMDEKVHQIKVKLMTVISLTRLFSAKRA